MPVRSQAIRVKNAESRLFRINDLGGNCSQEIDSAMSYTYPFVAVGLSGHISHVGRAIRFRFGKYQRAFEVHALGANRPETPIL